MSTVLLKTNNKDLKKQIIYYRKESQEGTLIDVILINIINAKISLYVTFTEPVFLKFWKDVVKSMEKGRSTINRGKLFPC